MQNLSPFSTKNTVFDILESESMGNKKKVQLSKWRFHNQQVKRSFEFEGCLLNQSEHYCKLCTNLRINLRINLRTNLK